MSASSVLREAGAALRFNKQRSILTMICLGWGVTCFVHPLLLRRGLRPARSPRLSAPSVMT